MPYYIKKFDEGLSAIVLFGIVFSPCKWILLFTLCSKITRKRSISFLQSSWTVIEYP